MITTVLELIRDELKAFVVPQFPKDTPQVMLGRLPHQTDASATPQEINRVLISLIHIQEERNLSQSRTSNFNGPYHFNLTLLFSMHENEKNASKGHLRSLQYLDAVLAFFQQNSTLTPQQNGGLPAEIPHLQFSLMNETLRDASYIWTMTGAKYVPSVLYMVRSAVVGNSLPAATRTSWPVG